MRTISVCLFSLLFFVGCQSSSTDLGVRAVEDVSPVVAAERVSENGALLIDVREAEEWQETGVAESAYLLSLSDLRGDRKQWDSFLRENGDRELLLYCRSGNRAGIAADILREEGYQVGNVGGFSDWQAAGLPERNFDDPRR